MSEQLIAEFEELAKQKFLIVESLPEKWQNQYKSAPLDHHAPMAVAAPARAPNKRPASATAHGGIMHGAILSEFDIKKDQIMKECSQIIQRLFRLNEVQKWFKEPVDVIKYNIPNYHTFVPVPMDLGTVKGKLNSKSYSSPLEFKADVDLTWANCFAYNLDLPNQPNETRQSGLRCQETWLKLWRDSKIEESWSQLQIEMNPKATLLPNRIGVLSSLLSRAIDSILPSGQPMGAGRDMTFSEKRRLSVQLSRLTSGEALQRVLDVVSEDPAVSSATDDTTLDVDLDQLTMATLWKLQELVEPAVLPAPLIPPPGLITEKKPADQNGIAVSVQSSGAAASDSESGDNEAKGSSMDDAKQSSAFLRDRQVDESATNNPKDSNFVKAAARKADVAINAKNWEGVVEEAGDAAGPSEAAPEGQQEGGDEMWKSFQTLAEQKQQREDQIRLEAELAEKQRKEDQERLKKEEEERQLQLKEEEEREQQQMKQQREDQLQQEIAEIQAKAGAANLVQADVAALANMPAPGTAGDGLAAAGLQLKDDDDEMNFDD